MKTARSGGRDKPLDAAQHIAPIRNFESIRNGDHLVQFYEDDKFLVQSVGAFVAQGFAQNQGAVLILTTEHRAAIEQKLRAGGADPREFRRRGFYYAFDAAETLACFMIDGRPDARRFRASIEPLIEVAAKNSSNVRAFGEMVALLWQRGEKNAAIELEMLWNDLLEKNNIFALLCAYPISSFSEEEKNRELRHICRAHNCVIPHESYCDPVPTIAH